jgi:hypothetical protein
MIDDTQGLVVGIDKGENHGQHGHSLSQQPFNNSSKWKRILKAGR